MDHSHSFDVLSALTASIYDCAVDPDLWPQTLAKLCHAMSFRSAALNLRAIPSGALMLNVTTSIEQKWLDMMNDYGPEMADQWGGVSKILTLSPNEPALMSRVHPEGLTENNRVYVEWTRPRGMIDVMGVGLVRDGRAYGTIAFGRHGEAGPVTDAELSLAHALVPHLQRSVAISRMLDIGSVKAAMFESVVDALSVGVIVTDTGLRVLHANAAAQKMLSDGMPVMARHGGFSVPAPGATAALSTAVARAAADETSLGPNGFGVPIRFDDGQTHVFHVLPLRSGQLRPAVQSAGDAAIFIAPSQKSPMWTELQVASLFDLTPAETRVFEGIATGTSLSDIADRSGIAVGTAKTHLLQVFAKTGCHRQAELVALAASLKVPVW